MRVTVDPARCSGHGNCVAAAPDLFDLDDDTDIAAPRKSRYAEADRSRILDAVTDCPAAAIAVDESST
ncbi:ferredoxin [Geodermatophilus sp. CPCC 206100]|uniref:ferredoxin n=1 Tax=Geodermatophilus sp. CPCC 206100 TaxID=3020054 RepID=UPI003B008F51